MVIETNITKMLGIKHPIIGAPMGPFYTTKLAVAISEAGGLGVLSHTAIASEMATGKTSVKAMEANLKYMVEYTDKPFGFNIRTSRLEPEAPVLCRHIPKFIMDNPKIREQCIYAITSAGSSKMLPHSGSFRKLKESGSNIKHFHVAPALWLADKCVASGVDGMVITGTEGGGHQSYEKVGGLVLLQQVRKKHPDFPIIACGGFATGEGLAAALSIGAGAIAMGSRFIASKESEFHENYKNIVPSAKASDTMLVTGLFGPIRYWRNKYALEQGLVANKEEKLEQEKSLTQNNLRKRLEKSEGAYLNGNITDGGVMLGQSIGIINSIENVSDIIDTIMKDAEGRLKYTSTLVK